ncbi:hypothetical protein C8J56DRAFT_1077853 [Mycena floridula]|nr:hypothetical protein C8J56DRAFT_1077853 [Mycena floridula]
MILGKFILTAFSTFIAVSAAPGVALDHRSEQASPSITICSGSASPAIGCVTIAIVSDSCINLTGALFFLNKEISGVTVPGGFVCLFFEDFGCVNGGVNGHDVAVLGAGTWLLRFVQGIAGTQSFDDLTSSISCSFI